jgi:outer membrane protein OmpA-like peptidoglycan-associated protein
MPPLLWGHLSRTTAKEWALFGIIGLLFVVVALFEPYSTEQPLPEESHEQVARDHLSLAKRLGFAILLQAGYATVELVDKQALSVSISDPKAVDLRLTKTKHSELQCLDGFSPVVVPGGGDIDVGSLTIALVAAEKYNRSSMHRQLEAWVARLLLQYQGKLPEFSFGLSQIRPTTARRLFHEELGNFELADRDLLVFLMNDCHSVSLAARYVKALSHQFASASSIDEIIAQVARTYSGAVTPTIHGLRYVDAVTGAYYLLVGKESKDSSDPAKISACVSFAVGLDSMVDDSLLDKELRNLLDSDQNKSGENVHVYFRHNDPGTKAYVAHVATKRRDWLVTKLVEMGYIRGQIAVTELSAPQYRWASCGDSKGAGGWARIEVRQNNSALMPALPETQTAPSTHLSSRVVKPSEKDEQQTRTAEKPLEGSTQPVQRTVLFDAGERVLKPEGGRQLREVVQLLHEQPTWRVRIEGYVDSEEVSSQQGSLQLSRKRGESVANYLTQSGVRRDRILLATAHDASQPVAPNDTLQGRAQNRRVVISLHPSP